MFCVLCSSPVTIRNTLKLRACCLAKVDVEGSNPFSRSIRRGARGRASRSIRASVDPVLRPLRSDSLRSSGFVDFVQDRANPSDPEEARNSTEQHGASGLKVV